MAEPSSAADAAGGSSAAQKAPPTSNNKQQQQYAQMKKLADANTKYKSLIKLAKERIQAQDEELETLRVDVKQNKEAIAEEKIKNAALVTRQASMMSDIGTEAGEGTQSVVRVCQRVLVEIDEDDEDGSDEDDLYGGGVESGSTEVWALVVLETYMGAQDALEGVRPKRSKEWKRFPTETALLDFIRRDTGEPLALPPYSLSPEQSLKIQEDAKKTVNSVSEEFRRFRVRAEVARKQTDATVKALHSSNVATTKRRIEDHNTEKDLEQARIERSELMQLRKDMAEQEAHWKEAYDLLMVENKALKSSASESLLASQWRQRFETCRSEKEDAVAKYLMQKEKVDALVENRQKSDAGKYEVKYRDVKESFRLYRKKAKEIFEAQQSGNTGFLTIPDKGTEEAKMEYIRNLMVNYLSSDIDVREHMEGAIMTVLNFSPGEIKKIEKRKDESW
eukprot:CAMPEP_0198280972 /NCGR_PEP_ID=MMETSP1449-20131203/1005_1 /TAXON_ID=420275 /ORGANISM="Attheya septentrionalis, Strain CCMP2084" /LENGTH=448 /DNA_ID=CAMNT_0043976577 /DNA_START=31 /DNA_END=1374 /DNA_ORIENTATION=+